MHCQLVDKPFHIRRLTLRDTDAILELRDEVIRAMPDPDLYVREENEHEFVRIHLGTIGESFGAFSQGRLIGYSALGLGLAGEDNLARYSDLPTEHYSKVAHLSASMVLPEFQGGHLHKTFVEMRLRRATELGKRHMFAMVSPRNVKSLGNMLLSGFQIFRIEKLYEGTLTRSLLYLDLGSPRRALYRKAVIVGSEDLEKQEALLFDGHRGRALLRHVRDNYLIYSL